MLRDYDIKDAFVNAIRRIPGGGVTVTTQEFVRQLELLNWHLSLRETSQWIKSYTSTFRDESAQEGQAETYKKFNPNGGI